MTGDPPVLDRPALWAALSHMQIDLPEPGASFERALASLQGWNGRFADRVTGEYRRFLYLAAIAGFEVTPSLAVDEAWHLHLRLPHYREVLCDRILGRPLDHLPGTGTEADDARCALQYDETLTLYERTFGQPAPRDIWPRPLEPGEEYDSEAPRKRARMFSRRLAIGSLAASLPALAFGFPALAVGLVGGAFLFFLLGQPSTPGGRSGGGCGVGGCGGFGSSSDDCGASCGGSCGGGSCGGGGCGGGD